MKLAVGTVQFGLNYGISNCEGQKTSLNEAEKILSIARDNNIDTLDTAQAYGDAEKVLGQMPINSFKIVTKLAPPCDLEKSLKNLKTEKVYGLLFHNADNLIEQPDLWEYFSDCKKNGLVEKIGISVYNKDQIDMLINKYPIDLVQLPLNIFDQRLMKKDHLKKLKDKGIEIHVRSVFLQGLIFLNPDELSSYFNPYKDFLKRFHETLKINNLTPHEAALGFVNSINEVDKIVCGVNSSEQLKDLINAMNKEINSDLNQEIFDKFSINDDALLNPSKWRL